MNTDIEKISNDLAAQAQGLRVVDQSSANRATQLILLGKEAIKKIKAFFAPLKQAQDEAKRKLLDSEHQELAKVEPIVEALSKSISTWRIEEDRKRREAEDAARRAEEERRRIEEEALRKVQEAEEAAERERIRLEEEAARLAKEAIRKAEDDAAWEKRQKRIEAERENLRQQAIENQKRVDEATDKVIDEAAKAEAALPAAPFIPRATETKGLRVIHNYSFVVDDKRALPEEYKIADEKSLNAAAREHGLAFRIPGGHVVDKPSMAAIGKRSQNGIGAS